MKRIICFLAFAFLASLVLAQKERNVPKLNFSSPSFDSPYYSIHFEFNITKEKTTFKELQLNGVKEEKFLVFKDGKKVEIDKALDPGIYSFIINYAWRNKKIYRMTLSHLPEKSKKVKKMEFVGSSPEQGGIPSFSCEEGFYRIYRVEEGIGIERKDEIVTLTLTAPKNEIQDGKLCIFDQTLQLPYQVIETKESTPPESVSKDHPQTMTYKFALSVNASPYQKKVICVFRGEKGPFEEKGFEISGEGLGKTIKGTRISVGFHPQSGQVNTLEYLKEGIKLHNKAGVIHWNPDCFIPGIAWDHSFDWNPPQSFEEKQGEFLYLNSRNGPMSKIKDVYLEVNYTFEREAPYFISETRMTAENDLGVIAVRNDEMVFSKELFDSLIYKTKKQGVTQMSLKEKESFPFGLVHIAPDDVEWIGLLNSKEDFGFFGLRLNYANYNPSPVGNFLHKPGTYFYAPSDGDYVYWVRPLLYTWAEYNTNNLLTSLPKGSSFYEKNAYILLPLVRDFVEKLDTLLRNLKNPLRVF